MLGQNLVPIYAQTGNDTRPTTDIIHANKNTHNSVTFCRTISGFIYRVANQTIYFKITAEISRLSEQFTSYMALNKIATISLKIYSYAFSCKKSISFWFKFHWKLFLGVQTTTTHHCLGIWLGAKLATNHYLNQCWPDSLMRICVTKERWVNLCKRFHSAKVTRSMRLWNVRSMLASL